MMRSILLLLLLGCAAGRPAPPPAPPPRGEGPQPPVARRVPAGKTLFGKRLTDDYAWLRKKESPEVRAYLKAENAYTDAIMRPARALEDRLYKEMLARIKQTDIDVPFRKRGWLYYRRTEEGKEHPIFARRRDEGAPEQVLLDVNALAAGHKFMEVAALEVSDDGNLLAYTTDTSGYNEHTLQIKDLRSGALLPERIEHVTGMAWAADHRTLFYGLEDEAKRPYRLMRHVLGTPTSADALVYEEKDRRFNLHVERSRSERYLLIGIESATTSEWRFVPADRPDAAPALIAARVPEQQYDVDQGGDLFYIRVNDRGRNFRLVTASVKDPRRERWKEIIPHREDVMLEDVQVFRDHYVLHERQDALPRVRVLEIASGKSRELPFSEPVYTVHPYVNAEFVTRSYRYMYTSLVTPSSVFEHDLDSGKSRLLKQEEVLGGYHPSAYEQERLFATAPDGARVPISLVMKKGLPRDGSAPMLLTGYGAYGIPLSPRFDPARLSLLDRGVRFGIAHVRGGGDLGKRWHDMGRMMRKRNTFTDFIACTEHLIRQGYTRSDRLAIEGTSAGGLLIGAVLNLRPELYRVAVANMPFVDIMNTMLDDSLPLTVNEFEEWGDPKVKEHFEYMLSYSPYDNVAARGYPALLVRSSLNDSQVMYFEPAKWVARLRAEKSGSNPLLLAIDMDPAGHGGKSGRYEQLRERAFIYSFILWRLGLPG